MPQNLCSLSTANRCLCRRMMALGLSASTWLRPSLQQAVVIGGSQVKFLCKSHVLLKSVKTCTSSYNGSDAVRMAETISAARHGYKRQPREMPAQEHIFLKSLKTCTFIFTGFHAVCMAESIYTTRRGHRWQPEEIPVQESRSLEVYQDLHVQFR